MSIISLPIESFRFEVERLPLSELQEIYRQISTRPAERIQSNVFSASFCAVADLLLQGQKKQIILERLIKLITNLEPPFFWKIWKIRQQQREYRLITKKKRKLIYNCELCHHPIEGETYQFQLRHDYICPTCWTKYIKDPSFLKGMEFLETKTEQK